jgi:hypothetical protein
MKINPVIYKKLSAQAEEAKEQGFTKLADSIFDAIGSYPNDELEEYSYGQLQDDIHRDLWKVATRFIRYYNIEALDVLKLEPTIIKWASDMLDDLESEMNVDNIIVGNMEPKVFGQE